MQAVDAARTQAERSFTQGSEKGLLEKTRKDSKSQLDGLEYLIYLANHDEDIFLRVDGLWYIDEPLICGQIRTKPMWQHRSTSCATAKKMGRSDVPTSGQMIAPSVPI